MCCVMHIKEPRTLIVKEKGLAPVFLDSRLEHPAGWICARYKSSVLLVWGANDHYPDLHQKSPIYNPMTDSDFYQGQEKETNHADQYTQKPNSKQ